MNGLTLATRVGLVLRECKIFSEQLEISWSELEQILREKSFQGIFVAWQIQSVIWGKIVDEKFSSPEPIDVEDWLEFRIFNEHEEFHFKRDGKIWRGRYIRDEAGNGDFYVDSFARLWGERVNFADGWITLRDDPRKISMTIPCDDGDKKFYGLTTRNYIGSDDDIGLSGYVDFRFVAIESAWGGD